MRNLITKWYRGPLLVRTLSYKKTDNVLPGLTRHIMAQGEPGDVIEVTHRHTELHIGTVKVRVGGIDSSWLWDHPKAKSA